MREKKIFCSIRPLELDVQPTFWWLSSANEHENIIDWWVFVLYPASAVVSGVMLSVCLSVDRPNTTDSLWQDLVSNRACDSVECDLRVSLNNRGFSCSLCAWSILHFDWAKFFASLNLTFRCYKASLFHAYWVISYYCFSKCFQTGCDHGCSFFYLFSSLKLCYCG